MSNQLLYAGTAITLIHGFNSGEILYLYICVCVCVWTTVAAVDIVVSGSGGI